MTQHDEWRRCQTHPDVNGATMWGCPDCLARLRSENANIKAAVKIILQAFDKGVFVRSTERDNNPKWAIELLPYIQALKQLHEVSVDAN